MMTKTTPSVIPNRRSTVRHPQPTERASLFGRGFLSVLRRFGMTGLSSSRGQDNRLKISVAFVPPKPKEFDITCVTFISRAVLGT
jgi:hypothetical protein